MPTLATTVNGMKLPNPFVIGSGPPGTNANVIGKALDEGWGGVVAKTISLDASKVINVAPRYARLRTEASASGELSLPYFLLGAPLTQPLTNRTTEAMCWTVLALAQVQAGQVQPGIRSARRALALAQESKNGWVHIYSTTYLTFGLLDGGGL